MIRRTLRRAGRPAPRPQARRATAGAVGLLLLLSAPGLAACNPGAQDGAPSSLPSPVTTPGPQLYADTTARMAQAGTAEFLFSGTGGGQPFAGSGWLRIDRDGFAGDVSLTLPASSQVRAVLSRDVAFLALPRAKGLPRAKPWVKVPADADTPVARTLQPVVEQLRSSFDPTQWLGLLRAAERVEELGPVRAEGVATTHYRALVKLRRARHLALGPTREQFQSMLDAGARVLQYDVWIDSTGLPRRYSASLPTMPAPHQLFSITGVYRDWGRKVRIVEPGPREVFDASRLKG